MYEDIKALKELLDSGAITRQEFEKKKAEILGIETAEDRAIREEIEAAQVEREQKEAATKAKRNAGIKKKAKAWGIVGGTLLTALLGAFCIWSYVIEPSIPKSAYIPTAVVHYYSDGEKVEYDLKYDEKGNMVRRYADSEATCSYEVDEKTGFCIKRIMASGETDYTQEVSETDGSNRPVEVKRTYDGGDTCVISLTYHEGGSIKSVSKETGGDYWVTEYYDEDGFLQNQRDSSGYLDEYDWNEDHTELTYHVESDKMRSDNQYFTYEYDSNGNVSKVYKSGKLYESYEYTLFENCSPWAYAWAKAKPVDQIF